MKMKLFGFGLLSLLFLGAGCATTETSQTPQTEPVIEPITTEPTPLIQQNVPLISTSILNLSVPKELTTETRSLELEGNVYQATISNVSTDRTENGGLLGDDYVITMNFSTTTRVITKDNFETRYTKLEDDLLLERAITKGTDLSGLRLGYFRSLESGEAVDIEIQAGSEAGIQNATSLLQQLEWIQ